MIKTYWQQAKVILKFIVCDVTLMKIIKVIKFYSVNN